MFVDGHEINSYCHRAQLFEPILPLNVSKKNEIVHDKCGPDEIFLEQIEKDFYIARPGHDTPDKTMPISDLHNPKGLEMYNTIMESSSKYHSRSRYKKIHFVRQHRPKLSYYINIYR
jgi:hypothetical protein